MENLRRFQDIEVKLVGAITPGYELSVASARTCYSGKGAIYPEDVSKDEKAIELRDRIASSTLEAGHVTTRQHAHFTFVFSGVSRQFIWNFLHSHPYYNSVQVSQRYVKVRRGNFVVPPMAESAERRPSMNMHARMTACDVKPATCSAKNFQFVQSERNANASAITYSAHDAVTTNANSSQ